MKAIILAGFLGERMKPLSRIKPKQLLPILSKTVIDHLHQRLYTAGVRDIALVVGETEEDMRRHFGDSAKYYVSEEHGTANGVYAARDFIDTDDSFYVVAGDIYCNDDFKRILESGPLIVSGYPVKNVSNYGSLEVKDGRLLRIKEKEGIQKPGLINASIYLFDRRIFPYIEKTPINPKRREQELTDTINIMIEEGNVFNVYNLRGRWRDIGYPRDLLVANLYALADLFNSYKNPY